MSWGGLKNSIGFADNYPTLEFMMKKVLGQYTPEKPNFGILSRCGIVVIATHQVSSFM